MAAKSGSTTASVLEFWRRQLSGDLPESHFSPNQIRSAIASPRYQRVEFEVDQSIVAGLALERAGEQDQVFAVLVASVAALLSKYTRGGEVVMGTPARSDLSREAQQIKPPVVLRIPVGRGSPFDRVRADAASVIAEAFDHEIGAFDTLLRILEIDSGPNRCALFDVAVRLAGFNEAFDLKAHPVDALFDFAITESGIHVAILYREDLYQGERIERLSGHYLNLIKAITSSRDLELQGVDILTPEERNHLVRSLNDNSVHFDTDRTIHELFEGQAERTPDAPAVAFRDDQLTYRELNERANRLARMLLDAGLGKGDFVAILQHRNCNFLVAMLAAFKAGAAYVPVDPTYPEDRIQYMLSDCQATTVISEAEVLVANEQLLGQIEGLRTVICHDREIPRREHATDASRMVIWGPKELRDLASENLELPLTSRDRAYMIYTSGSTGRPKGAICRHDGALNHLFGELHGLGIDGAFSFLQSAASSSDISVWQFLAPVLRGGTSVVVDHATVTDPERLFEVIKSKKLSLVELVPVVLRALVDHVTHIPTLERGLPGLACMMATGDALPVDVVNRWFEQYPDVPIANTYGPTEASDDITLFVTRTPLGADRSSVPIGPPMANLNIFILDPGLDLVPFGVPGEICVSGIGVGEGYWRQPEKTSAAFVPNPVEGASGETIYRTGDLGRWLEDGSVEFLGRIDLQVKIRGFRIEPAEVQAALLTHPGVNDAAIVTKLDSIGNNRLVAYFVAKEDQEVRATDLREYLSRLLADYMIPSAFVALPAMPLTPIGKVDHRALPEVAEFEVERSEAYVPPTSATEIELARIWSELLEVADIGVHDDYVALGGNSILSISIVERASRVGIRLRPADVFEHRTIAELARSWDQGAAAERGAEGADATAAEEAAIPFALCGLDAEALEGLKSRFPTAEDAYPLSPTQTGIYLQHLLTKKGSGVYIEQILFTTTGELDLIAFQRAWSHVIAHFPVLRTIVNRRGTPRPLQVVLESAPFNVTHLDWRGRRADVNALQMDDLVKRERMAGFDLSKWPLMRVTVVQTEDESCRVIWTYHHLILDGWSEPLVLHDVLRAYAALSSGSSPEVPSAPPYRRFIEWLNRQGDDGAEAFWESELSGFERPSSLPTESAPAERGSLSHGWIELSLSPEDTRRCHETAKRLRLTTSTLLQGAWALVLARFSHSEDILFGSAESGRQIDLGRVGDIPGLFLVTLPVRASVRTWEKASDWLKSLQKRTVAIRRHEHFSLATMQNLTQLPDKTAPMFETIFVVANYPDSDLAVEAGSKLSMDDVEYITMPHYPITVFVVPQDGMKVRIVFERGRFPASGIMAALEAYRWALLQISRDSSQSLGSLMAAMSLT